MMMMMMMMMMHLSADFLLLFPVIVVLLIKISLTFQYSYNNIHRVLPVHGKSWNLGRPFSRPGKSWKINVEKEGAPCIQHAAYVNYTS